MSNRSHRAAKRSASHPGKPAALDLPGCCRIVRGRSGYYLINRNDMYIGRAIEKYGEFSHLEWEVLRQLCGSGDLVLEVGANIGAHTLDLAWAVGPTGRVHAFEPQRIIFQMLCANMALNGITNVHCHHAAAGAEDGYAVVPELDYSIKGNFGSVSLERTTTGERVPKVRLDSLLALDRLRLLKIDVEGMEQEVILGARALIERFKPVLYVENDRLDRSEPLILLIAAAGYRLFWHLPLLFNPENFFNDSENIFPNIVSANMLCFHRSCSIDITGFSEITDPTCHPFRR